MEQLETGDLILYHCKKGWFGKLIQLFTKSDYSHVGIVLKDPSFVDPPLVGMFFWESSDEHCRDAENTQFKIGVEIVDLTRAIQDAYKRNTDDLYYRKLKNCPFVSNEKWKEIHDVVHNKPYDFVPKDWIEGLIQRDPDPQKTDRFWCSALVGYVYTQMGLLPAETDWSIMRPCDFSSDYTLPFLGGVSLEKEVYLPDIPLDHDVSLSTSLLVNDVQLSYWDKVFAYFPF